MKTQKLIPALILGLMFIASCKPEASDSTAQAGQTKSADASNKEESVAEKVYNVKTSKIDIDTLTRSIENTATFDAFEEIHFAPASPGRIDQIYVEIGDKVTKGQKLADMDQTQLKQAKIQFNNAKINLDRIKQLRKTESISEQQLDQVQMAFDVAKSNVEFLEENTVLLSPINGVVTGKYYENGEMYSGAPNTQAGKAALVSLMQIQPLKATVSISESYFPSIRKGMSATIKADTYNDLQFNGKIYRIHPTINAATRTFMVEIITPNKDEKLRPGMFGRVDIKLKSYVAMVVPAIAVQQQEGTNTRFVFLNNNGIAKRVNVKLGKRFNDKLEIISDELKVGDELVVVGQANLMDNYKINVIK